MLGTCINESLVIDIFGSVSEFARQCELHGDNFIYRNVIIEYDKEKDIHKFSEFFLKPIQGTKHERPKQCKEKCNFTQSPTDIHSK